MIIKVRHFTKLPRFLSTLILGASLGAFLGSAVTATLASLISSVIGKGDSIGAGVIAFLGGHWVAGVIGAVSAAVAVVRRDELVPSKLNGKLLTLLLFLFLIACIGLGV